MSYLSLSYASSGHIEAGSGLSEAGSGLSKAGPDLPEASCGLSDAGYGMVAGRMDGRDLQIPLWFPSGAAALLT